MAGGGSSQSHHRPAVQPGLAVGRVHEPRVDLVRAARIVGQEPLAEGPELGLVHPVLIHQLGLLVPLDPDPGGAVAAGDEVVHLFVHGLAAQALSKGALVALHGGAELFNVGPFVERGVRVDFSVQPQTPFDDALAQLPVVPVRRADAIGRARVCGKWDEIKAEMNKGEEKPLNDGHVFEKFLTMEAGQTWKRDRVPFWQDGDLTTGGRKYQIKMENAEFSTYTNIRSAIAARA